MHLESARFETNTKHHRNHHRKQEDDKTNKKLKSSPRENGQQRDSDNSYGKKALSAKETGGKPYRRFQRENNVQEYYNKDNNSSRATKY